MASLDLDEKMAEYLLARASAQGITVEELIRRLLRQEGDTAISGPRLSSDELDRILDEEATDTPGLPADFSRADIYLDHD